MSQSGAKRDNSQYRVRLPKSVSVPIADALKEEATADATPHRDKIEAVAVRCAFRQAGVAKMLQSFRRPSKGLERAERERCIRDGTTAREAAAREA